VAVSKLRNIRVDDRLWAEAKRIAGERRETLSAVIKRALVEYVERVFRAGGKIARSAATRRHRRRGGRAP
jgi:predicted transcriptional regulator